MNKDLPREGAYQAPLVSQNSDDEAEQEVIHNNKQQNSELQQLHTFLQQQTTKCAEEERILIDYEVVERVENYGYPRNFIVNSIENNEMNDAGTCYYLLDKEKGSGLWPTQISLHN